MCLVTQLHPTRCDTMDCSLPGSSLCPWKSSGKNTGVGCHFLLQGSSWPRDQTHISCFSCIVGRFFNTVPPGKSCKSTILQQIVSVKKKKERKKRIIQNSNQKRRSLCGDQEGLFWETLNPRTCSHVGLITPWQDSASPV